MMVFDLILPVLIDFITDPIKQYVVSPMTRHISYAFRCEHMVQTLQDEVEQLKSKKERLQQSVDDASRNGDEIYSNVTRWLTSADKAIGDAEELVQHKEEAKKKKCFVGFCPNLKTRYQLSKKADKRVLAIDKLKKEGELESVSFRPRFEQIVEPSVYSREALSSRLSLLNQIMDALKDPNFKMIGVYGMGGVGKTTLAKEVQGKAMQEKLFESVVLVAVSQTPEVRRIQAEIADFLGLKFDMEEIPGRASQLYKRLNNSKVLVILDDVWQKLDLNAVGIPLGDASEGCKILITSRRKDVLSIEMETQKEFPLDVLREDEALSLFQAAIAKTKDPKLRSIATEIAKKCSGLPLLILIVAKELQNKEYYAWVDMLRHLSTFGNDDIHNKVHKVLESSFDNLPGEEVKSLFLLCSLFSQSNIRIQHLLIYSMGLGLFKHRVTIEEGRGRLLTLINKLKDESLLLDSDTDMHKFVKMHDVVRDVAISIASRLQHAFIGAGRIRLRDWPKQDCSRISLPYCDIYELPANLRCPETESFLLFTEDLCLEIPDSFFERVGKLKVVDLTGMRLVSLPSSLGLLSGLHALCLHRCRLNNVALIAKLNQLEILSFADSEIVELPREMGELSQLKLLDLTNCTKLQVIPEKVISKLSLLEELYLLNSFVGWDDRGNASLVELEDLSQLSTLEIQIANPKLIRGGCRFFQGLRSYKISIGSSWGWRGKYETTRTLKLKLEGDIHMEDGIGVLLRKSEDLYLEVSGIGSVLYDLDRDGFPQLKHLHVTNDDCIQHIIRSRGRASCHAFPILESLYLDNLKGLEKFAYGQFAIGSAARLQFINIRRCHKLESLLSYSFSQLLTQLQELEVDTCNNMRAIVEKDSGDYKCSDELIEFSRLSSLKLISLPHLEGFCKRQKETGQREFRTDAAIPSLLFNETVSFPNLTSLEVTRCYSLKYLFTTSTVECLKQLKKLEISHCDLVEEIIKSEEFEEIEEENFNKIVFPKLDSVLLSGLKNMRSFGCGYLVEFPGLRELHIERCASLRNFVSKYSDSRNSEYIFNEMVLFPNLENLIVRYMHEFRFLWKDIAEDSFSKLKSLSIEYCSKLSSVFPSNVYKRFQGMEALYLFSCDRVEEVYPYQGINCDIISDAEGFALQDLQIRHAPSLKHIWHKDASEAFTFENLQSLEVDSCKDLKYVFPASIARGLLQLQQLRLANCDVEVIITNAMYENSETRKSSKGAYLFEWPCLKCLEIRGCDQVLEFVSDSQENGKELQNAAVKQLPFFAEKLIPNLEELTVDHQGLKALWTDEFPVEFFSKVRKVSIFSIGEEFSPLLRELYSLEKLGLIDCSLEEIFFLREVGEQQPQLRLKHLELRNVRCLKEIVKKDSQLNSILQYLHTLDVKQCDDLIDIAASSASFRNLTIMNIEGCNGMRYMVTALIAKTMVHLMELRVSSCHKMEQIVAMHEDCAEHDEIVFNKLKLLEFFGLHNLNSFCFNRYKFSFPLLEEVTVSFCSKMKVFCRGVLITPKLRGVNIESVQQWEGDLNSTIASQLRVWVGEHFEEEKLYKNIESMEMVNNASALKAISADQLGFLNKLRNIVVRNCNSMQVVFDLEGVSAGDGHVRFLPQLYEMEFINLPMLIQICNRSPKDVLDFNKLKVLKIENCSQMVHAFSCSMASCLFQLQDIELKNCEMMETIVKEEEGDNENEVIFCSLKSVVLEWLPNLQCIYSGHGNLQCPSLRKIRIRKCQNLKAFISRFTMEDKQGSEDCNIQFNCKVFPKVEKVYLDVTSISAISQFEFPINFLSEVTRLHLGMSKSSVSLSRFLSRLPSLYKLVVSDSSLEDLFDYEPLTGSEEGTQPPQIRVLKLLRVDDMKQIWRKTSQYHASLFDYLETLEVRNCADLMNLASFSMSFRNLTTLEVVECNQLLYLMTPSLAKSMSQLVMLNVKSCNIMLQIVGDGNNETTDEIIFPKMKGVKLYDLQSLQCFSMGHYSFSFPCLDKLVMLKCPNVRTFCPGILVTPKLNDLAIWQSHWKGDLNTSIEQLHEQMAGLEYLTNVKLSSFPMLKRKWGDKFPFYFLHSLETLVVDDCGLLSNAISSNMLLQFASLKVLIVEKCGSVEQVFDLEGLRACECVIKPMKDFHELQLINLPRLRDVWSKDPLEILSFKNLKLLKIHNCSNLTYICNLSMALSLQNLQHLEVKNCNLVEHIIQKAEAETTPEYQSIFPSLHTMNLQCLTIFSSFYCTKGCLEFPSLKVIEVIGCPNVEFVASTFPKGQDSFAITEEKKKRISGRGPNSFQTILGNKIATPRLEGLKVEWSTLKDILNANNRTQFLSKLKFIEISSFPGESAILPANLLQSLTRLEKLVLSDALIEEINLDDLSIMEEKHPRSFALLKKLTLSNLPNLKHLIQDYSQLAPVFQNLEDLVIVECSNLKTLVPFTASLDNLKYLEVSRCDGLINLMTPQTAKSLVQLKRLNVKECNMMREIVAISLGTVEHELCFNQLEYLELDDMPLLESFCSGEYSFNFPSLEEAVVTNCPSMKIFTEKAPLTPKLREVRTGRRAYERELGGSLDKVIRALHSQKGTC